MDKELIEELFTYDEEGGELYRIKKSQSYSGAARPAGCINSNGYSYVAIKGIRYLTHRIIFLLMTGELPEQVDHINHDRADNRWENLRAVSNQENARNSPIRSTNTSGTTGVTWEKRFKKWCAQITVDGKNKFLGYYCDKKEAIVARKIAENEYGFHVNHGGAI